MRKISKGILLLMAALSFSAFGNEKAEKNKVLITYFSVPENVKNNGVDGVGGASVQFADGKLVGNTQLMAMMIQERTEGELFEIKTKVPYPREHEALVEQADANYLST